MAAAKKPATKRASDRVYDLDQARAARAEKRGNQDPPSVKFGNQHWELPAEIPLDFALAAQEERLRDAVTELFGEEQAVQFFELRPSIEDVTELLEAIMGMYGVEPGN